MSDTGMFSQEAIQRAEFDNWLMDNNLVMHDNRETMLHEFSCVACATTVRITYTMLYTVPLSYVMDSIDRVMRNHVCGRPVQPRTVESAQKKRPRPRWRG